MSEEQINTTIAEACGWTYEPEEFPDYPWLDEEGEGHRRLPDYCNNLNAMHEAEKRLTGMDRAEFAVKLCRIAGREWPNGIGGGCFVHVHATAKQRAEAFLRTIGKWEENNK